MKRQGTDPDVSEKYDDQITTKQSPVATNGSANYKSNANVASAVINAIATAVTAAAVATVTNDVVNAVAAAATAAAVATVANAVSPVSHCC